MNLIKPSYEIIEQPSGIDGLYKHIELCGRTCYKSQDRITEDSAKKFVDGLIKSGHGSVLEHGTVYLYKFYNTKKECFDDDFFINYHYNEYSRVVRVKDDILNPKGAQHIYITTNFRVIEENNWLDDLKYLCEPTEYHEKRVTVKFICDIGISREFNRHRVDSVSEQSTRYCNYSKDKFGNVITYIIPNDCPSLIEGSKQEYSPFEITDTEVELMNAYQDAQRHYLNLIDLGWKPQQARRVLPLGTATELIHTAFISDWEHFFKLRDHSAAHPQAIELAKPLHEEFIKRNLI
jgi:thymidylate synthase (FAD)